MNATRILLRAALGAVLAVQVAPAIAAVPAPQPAAPALRLPAPVEKTLPNGLRVIVFTDTRLPIVHVQLMVPAGSAAESDGQAGVASLAVALLREGTPSRTPEQLAGDFAQLGATFDTRCFRDFALVACGARSGVFENTLEVMSDVVLNPLFGSDGFAAARMKQAMKAGVLQGSLADLADARVAADLFGPHPYAHDPVAGDPRLLATIELSALQEFHRDRWRPDRSVLVIAGDVTADRAFAAATDWFGRWDGRTAPERPRPAAKATAGVHIADVPGAGQAEVRVAVVGPGLAAADHDAWALALAAFQGVRLPDGARAETEEGRDAGMLVLKATVAPGAAAATAKALVAALKTAAATPPAGEELAALRRRVAQRYPLTLATLGAFVSQWQALDFAGATQGAVADLGRREAAADPAAGLRYLAAPPVVLVAGPAATLRAPLEAAGLGDVRLDAIVGQGSAAQAEAPAAVTPEMSRRGKAAVAAAIAAHGGAAALEGVKTLIMEGSITMRADGQDIVGQFSAVREDPDRFSFASRFLTLESRQLCSGGQGWLLAKTDSTRITALDSLGVLRLRSQAASDLVHQLRLASAPGANPVWRGTEPLADRKCDLVEFTTPYGLQRLSIDTETHQVLELGNWLGRRGGWSDRRRLSDFRRVNGLLLPWAEDRTMRGERVWRLASTSVAINREVPEVLFARPEAQ